MHDEASHDRFLRLFTANDAAIRGFVRSLVPSRQDADDVMQEVAVVLWKKFSELPDEDFRRWSFGVARYAVLAWRRDKARDRHVFGDDTLDLLAGEAESTTAADELRREALENCLTKLPNDQRELVRKAYEPGTRIDEMAKALGRTAMALYKSLHRIRLTLIECTRQELGKEGLL